MGGGVFADLSQNLERHALAQLFGPSKDIAFNEQWSRARAAVPIWAEKLDLELRQLWLARMDGDTDTPMSGEVAHALASLLRAFGWPEKPKAPRAIA
ncbi:hypothetical protein K2X14_11650 [Acetobacter sp. TBRC 12305]|nr:hypothetical protein [Acetobacter garciniae]MBX0345493.1 hypothetical protein [Acetobacter garciniae]